MKNFSHILHVIVTIVFVIAPITFPWYVITLFFVFWYIHILIFKQCVLTLAEFGGKKDKDFSTRLLRDLGFRVDEKFVRFYTMYLQVWVLSGIAYFIQEVLKLDPLLSLL